MRKPRTRPRSLSVWYQWIGVQIYEGILHKKSHRVNIAKCYTTGTQTKPLSLSDSTEHTSLSLLWQSTMIRYRSHNSLATWIYRWWGNVNIFGRKSVTQYWSESLISGPTSVGIWEQLCVCMSWSFDQEPSMVWMVCGEVIVHLRPQQVSLLHCRYQWPHLP